MDPNLFRLDWERVTEVLATIVILSFLLERALAIVFTHRWYIGAFHKRGFKSPIAFALAGYVCWRWRFDALSMIILTDSITVPGTLITAGVIAGGSQASLKLFRDVVGFQAEVEKEVAQKKQDADAAKANANAQRPPSDAEAAKIKAELNTGAPQ